MKEEKTADFASMSTQDLLIALYERAIRDLEEAKKAKDDKEESVFAGKLDHFDRIVLQLCSMLDRSQEISTNLYRLYEFLHYEVGELLAKKADYAKEIPAMIGIVTNLRDGFRGAEEQLQNGGSEKSGSKGAEQL